MSCSFSIFQAKAAVNLPGSDRVVSSYPIDNGRGMVIEYSDGTSKIYHDDSWRDEGEVSRTLKQEFLLHPSGENFDRLPSFQKENFAMALMQGNSRAFSTERDPDSPCYHLQTEKKTKICDQALIDQSKQWAGDHYLSDLSPDRQALLAESALDQIVFQQSDSFLPDMKREELMKLAQKALHSHSRTANSVLCTLLADFKDTPFDDSFERADETPGEDQVAQLYRFKHLIEDLPEAQLGHLHCETLAKKGDFISDFLKRAEAKIPPELRDVGGVEAQIRRQSTLDLEPSACTLAQAKKFLSSALLTSLNAKGANDQLIVIQEGECRIHGLLQKSSQNFFEFQLNYGLPVRKRPALKFVNLAEALQLFMATQQKPMKSPIAGAPAVNRPSSVEDPASLWTR